MESSFRSFRKVLYREEAEGLMKRLTDAGLHPRLQENAAVFDVTFTTGGEKDLHVLLPATEFVAAEALLDADAAADHEELPGDHYLRTFTEEELRDVVRKPDEWSAYDRVQAERLLLHRGHHIDQAEMAAVHEARLEELARPEKARRAWLAAGIIMIWIGGVGGMVIGWSLMAARRTLPDGSLVPRYTEGDRRTGQAIFVCGLIVLLGTAWLFARAMF